MTKQEYTQLMGYKGGCTDKEFKEAEEIYMAAGEMTKQEFCAEWRKLKGSLLVKTLADQVKVKHLWGDAQKRAVDTYKERDRILGGMLVENAQKHRTDSGDSENELAGYIEGVAGQMMGMSAYIRYKLERGYHLSEEDRQYITENLR